MKDNLKCNPIKDSNCIIVIPIYKKSFDKDELMCVKRYFKILEKRDICFVSPESLDKSWYKEQFGEVQFVNFKDKYFKGIKGYNKLLLSIEFYERFKEYKYMLIAQPDACVMTNEDMIDGFISSGYDYIGAPWIPERRIYELTWHKKERFPHYRLQLAKKKGQGIEMGNGGFCLRNIEKSKALIKEFSWRKIYWFFVRNEDIFFGLFGRENRCGYNLADVQTGLRFAREYDLRKSFEEGHIPFGIHGYKKEFESYDELSQFMKERGIWKD